MYQFSMKWFRDLFITSFTYSPEKIKDIKGRVKQLRNDFSMVLYQNVCRSLFEQHKLMFAFNMAIKLHYAEDSAQTDKKGIKMKDIEMLQNLQGSGEK